MDIRAYREYAECKFLLKGTVFTSVYKEVEIQYECKWIEDWDIEIKILSFKGLNENISFWLDKLQGVDDYYLSEILREPLHSLPEVILFEERIKEINDRCQADPRYNNLIDNIIDTLEKEGCI